MKFTLSWLKDHLDTKANLGAITGKLTAIGLEVERIIDSAQAFKDFVIADVVECKKHPNADKLSVCMVDAGDGPVQVVCGAPNARKGMKGVFAPSGTHIPGTGLDLKPTEIRGVKSNGMLCSEKELMLSEDHDGIIDLPGDAPVGESYATYAGLDDPMIEIAITPNRQDCLGVQGIARDLAAAGLGKLKDTAPKPVKGKGKGPIAIKLDFNKEDTGACPVFAGRYVKGIKNGQSPEWLKQRLRAIGLRPISALVDITNYITYDRGRPLHVYDVKKLKGDVITRIAKKGEKILALDGNEYEMAGFECVIADSEKIVDLGGVMGSEGSSCTEDTTDVLIEAALFDPVLIAKTGRSHGIESDARYRFERGVDPEFVIPGIELATRMILEFCGGEASEIVIAGAVPKWSKTVDFRTQRVKTLGGIDLTPQVSLDILARLGFTPGPVKGGVSKVGVPSWRVDIAGEADLVEEVLRIHGYDEIPITTLEQNDVVPKPVLTTSQKRVSRAKRALAAAGFVECVTYSFMPSRLAKTFGGGADMVLENPISSELDAMRPSILPNLMQAGQRNATRGGRSIALFEVGPQYADQTPEGQTHVAAGILLGAKTPRHWSKPSENPGAMDAKAAAFTVLKACGFKPENTRTDTDVPAWYHPHRSGVIKLGPKNTLGFFGEIHPGITKKMNIKGIVAAFEVLIDNLPPEKAGKAKTKPVLDATDLPMVERDFAFVVKDEVKAGAIIAAVKGADTIHIIDVSVFDVFTGKDLPRGVKSVAVSARLAPTEKTFTEAEIEAISASIIAVVAKRVGGKLRT